MSEKKERRVIFYGKNDISAGWNLNNAEKLLNKINIEDDFGLNDYLEFYNINKYLENEIYLIKWNKEDIKKYTEISKKLFKKTILFFNNTNNENIINLIDELDFEFENDFWELINKYKIYKKISVKNFVLILYKESIHISTILKYKDIVKIFDKEIKDYLLNYEDFYIILLNYMDSNKNDEKLYFPNSLSESDKNNIILKFIESENPNPNFLETITKLPNFSAGIKLKAKKKYDDFNHKFFKNKDSNTSSIGYKISFDPKQENPFIDYSSVSNFHLSYSTKFFDNLDYINNPLDVFLIPFGFFGTNFLIKFYNRDYNIDGLELAISNFLKSDYKTNSEFKNNEIIVLAQLGLFQDYLKNKKLSLEKLINNYIENKLTKIKGLVNIDFILDEISNVNSKEIRDLASKFDFFIKQYNCYIENGNINFELLNIDSKSIRFNEIKSNLENKYFYINNSILETLAYYFYSNQSGLFYIEGFEGKYNNYYDLIINEQLKLENFVDYQKEKINLLIKEDYLFIDKNDYIKIKDKIFIFLVGELFRDGVLNYYSYDKKIKEKIIEMKNKDLILSKSTLLAEQEADYFDYYLNKKFTNGPDIRNKNIHGYKYITQDEAKRDYLILLKIIILTLLKIEFEINYVIQ